MEIIMWNRKDKGLMSQGIVRYKKQRKYSIVKLFISLIFVATAIIFGVLYPNNNLVVFICSCAVGLFCGSVTTFFADSKMIDLLELDYRIAKIDEFIKKCDLKMNLFDPNHKIPPRKMSLYTLAEVDVNYYWLILCRMGHLCKEISESNVVELHELSLFFISNENRPCEPVTIGDFIERISKYSEEMKEDFMRPDIEISAMSYNKMFSNNIMIIMKFLERTREELVLERENAVFKRKTR